MPAKTTIPEKKTSQHKEEEKQKTLTRSKNNKVIAGVAGGIGEYFNIDPTIIRLIFILLTVFGGSGILIYLILWLIMPGPDTLADEENVIKQNIDDMSEKAKSFAHDLNFRPENSNDSKFWWGFFIIIIGIILLFQNFGIFDIINFEKFWPLLIVFLGLFILFKKK